MAEWKPIEEARPRAGDMALIIAYDTDGRGRVFDRGPQLCVWKEYEGEEGWWNQMLRGDEYGLGLDGTARLFTPVVLPRP